MREGRDVHYTAGCCFRAGLTPKDMPALYQLWDALLYLSGGEGFGVPAWEAMSSELPVVYTNYSSHAEFLGLAGAGIPVGGILQPEPVTCIQRLVPDVAQALDAVRRLYQDRKLGAQLGQRGRTFTQMYSPPTQSRRWHQLFQECQTLPQDSSGI